MRYANLMKEQVQILIHTSPICLDSNNFVSKASFNKVLKLMEYLNNFRFMF